MYNLIKKNQSGFIPRDSTINQLIAMCNQLYKCIDEEDEMVAVFHDLFKSFDRVWHKGFYAKLKRLEFVANCLNF